MKKKETIDRVSCAAKTRGRLADTFNWDNAVVVFDKEERRGTKKKKK